MGVIDPEMGCMGW